MYKNFVNITLVDGPGYLGLQSKIGMDSNYWKYFPGEPDTVLKKCLKHRNKTLIDNGTAPNGILLRHRKLSTSDRTNKNYSKYMKPYINGDDISKTNTINIRLINLRKRAQTNVHCKFKNNDKPGDLLKRAVRLVNKNTRQYNEIVDVYNRIRLKEFNRLIRKEVRTLVGEAYMMIGFCPSTWTKATIIVCNKGFKSNIEFIK